MEIGVARVEEVEALAPLWREMMEAHGGMDDAYRLRAGAEEGALEHFRRICAAEDRLLLVCRGEGVCGYLSASIRPAAAVFVAARVGVINELFVSGESRRQGIGRRLYEEAWGGCGRGIRRVEVRTLVKNGESAAFWSRLGFEPYATEWKAGMGGE